MENDKTQKPSPETRPHPGGETRPRPQLEGESRSASHVAALALEGTAAGVGLTTGKLVVEGVAAKVKDALAPKDDGPKIILPGDPED